MWIIIIVLFSLGSYPSCSKTLEDTPVCYKSCTTQYSLEYSKDKHFGEKAYWLSGESNMKNDIYLNGPVEASLSVYSDFLSYKSGKVQERI